VGGSCSCGIGQRGGSWEAGVFRKTGGWTNCTLKGCPSWRSGWRFCVAGFCCVCSLGGDCCRCCGTGAGKLPRDGPGTAGVAFARMEPDPCANAGMTDGFTGGEGELCCTCELERRTLRLGRMSPSPAAARIEAPDGKTAAEHACSQEESAIAMPRPTGATALEPPLRIPAAG